MEKENNESKGRTENKETSNPPAKIRNKRLVTKRIRKICLNVVVPKASLGTSPKTSYRSLGDASAGLSERKVSDLSDLTHEDRASEFEVEVNDSTYLKTDENNEDARDDVNDSNLDRKTNLDKRIGNEDKTGKYKFDELTIGDALDRNETILTSNITTNTNYDNAERSNLLNSKEMDSSEEDNIINSAVSIHPNEVKETLTNDCSKRDQQNDPSSSKGELHRQTSSDNKLNSESDKISPIDNKKCLDAKDKEDITNNYAESKKEAHSNCKRENFENKNPEERLLENSVVHNEILCEIASNIVNEVIEKESAKLNDKITTNNQIPNKEDTTNNIKIVPLLEKVITDGDQEKTIYFIPNTKEEIEQVGLSNKQEQQTSHPTQGNTQNKPASSDELIIVDNPKLVEEPIREIVADPSERTQTKSKTEIEEKKPTKVKTPFSFFNKYASIFATITGGFFLTYIIYRRFK